MALGEGFKGILLFGTTVFSYCVARIKVCASIGGNRKKREDACVFSWPTSSGNKSNPRHSSRRRVRPVPESNALSSGAASTFQIVVYGPTDISPRHRHRLENGARCRATPTQSLRNAECTQSGDNAIRLLELDRRFVSRHQTVRREVAICQDPDEVYQGVNIEQGCVETRGGNFACSF